MRGFDIARPRGLPDKEGMIVIILREEQAFIPRGSPYLGQAIPGEPVGQSNVSLPNRRPS